MRHSGYSLVELLAALAIFGIFLFVLTAMQREFFRFDREIRVAMFTHPSPLSVLARLRRDILDSSGYPDPVGTWRQSPETLLLDTITESEQARVVIWDFRETGIARRIELEGDKQVAEWEARAVPAYGISKWVAPDGRFGVVITAKDGKGNVVVHQIVTPRAR